MASIISLLKAFKSDLLKMLSGADDEYVASKDGEHDKSNGEDDMNAETHDESESLSEIDDKEVINELHASCIGFSLPFLMELFIIT